jgi:hypothetical protein
VLAQEVEPELLRAPELALGRLARREGVQRVRPERLVQRASDLLPVTVEPDGTVARLDGSQPESGRKPVIAGRRDQRGADGVQVGVVDLPETGRV